MAAGVYIDFARDGFGTGAGGEEAGFLARMMPEGAGSATSDDFTASVMSYTITRGLQSEITGGSASDSCTIIVQNTDHRFDPDNTASDLYNKLGPGCPVWIGVNGDGTLSGAGTVYGRFAGVVREVAPIPVGASLSPTAEILCDGILADYALTPVVLTDSTTRSQGTFRAAVLTAVGETRTSLASEPDSLPLSSADSTSALSVLDELNRANGSRHFIAPADNPTDWYDYTTRNRHYKLGAAADATVDAGAQHVTSIDGWRLNNDGIINSQRATIDPVRFTVATATVWQFEGVPFNLNGNKVIWANFDDYVQSPVLSVNSSGGLTSSLTAFGRSAKITLSGSGVEITELSIEGIQVERDSTITLTGEFVAEAGPSQARYRVRSGSDLSGDLLGAQASAQGIVDHTIYRYAGPLKRPRLTVVNWLPTMFTLNPFDILATTVDAVSASAVKFDVVGITETCTNAATGGPIYHEITFQLVESRVQGTVNWFTLNSSTLNSVHTLGY